MLEISDKSANSDFSDSSGEQSLIDSELSGLEDGVERMVADQRKVTTKVAKAAKKKKLAVSSSSNAIVRTK